MITISEKEWHDLSYQLSQEWPFSVMVIRSKMKEELGFTVQVHKQYSEQRGTQKYICLDFYDEAKETWFRLKYL